MAFPRWSIREPWGLRVQPEVTAGHRPTEGTGQEVAVNNTTGDGSKRAVLYARVITKEQARSGYSLA